MSNPRSTAKIAGHPIHPMIIPFPVAFFVSTFLADIAFVQTGNTLWVQASQWLLGGRARDGRTRRRDGRDRRGR
jgi:uncharacterized membrane protein